MDRSLGSLQVCARMVDILFTWDNFKSTLCSFCKNVRIQDFSSNRGMTKVKGAYTISCSKWTKTQLCFFSRARLEHFLI